MNQDLNTEEQEDNNQMMKWIGGGVVALFVLGGFGLWYSGFLSSSKDNNNNSEGDKKINERMKDVEKRLEDAEEANKKAHKIIVHLTKEKVIKEGDLEKYEEGDKLKKFATEDILKEKSSK